MPKYFCQKCNSITSETKEYFVIKNKLCVICGEITFSTEPFLNIETKERIKNRGKIWLIHQNDNDTFFGSKHAHNEIDKMVLNLDTGEIFNKITRKKIRKMKEKELKEIKSKSRFFKDTS